MALFRSLHITQWVSKIGHDTAYVFLDYHITVQITRRKMQIIIAPEKHVKIEL